MKGEDRMPLLYVLCGPSGCGKTTWAKEFVKDHPEIVYVSRDTIRFSMMKDADEYFAHEKETFKNFVSTIVEGLRNGKDVIADATHLNECSRKKLINAIDNHTSNYSIIYIVFKTDLKTCLKHNEARTGRARVPKTAIQTMYNNFRMPDMKEDKRIVDICCV